MLKNENQPPMNINFQNLEQLNECLEAIVDRIDRRAEKISNRELLEMCSEANDFFSRDTNPHFCHEIAEAAINSVIKEKYAEELLASSNPPKSCTTVLKPLAARLPTQTWRSHDQNIRQQFSTPPAIAYLLAYLLNLKAGEQVLEPSAGTGSLATWASGFELKTHVNEIEPRRRELLSILGFQPTAYNAEFLDDFLAPDVRADCVLMNPPFSSNGGRTTNNSSKFGFRHVQSALERLERGGRFGIILGEAAELTTKTGNEFWCKMAGKLSVKAIIKIDGREYYKNGTSVDVNLIVGTKRFAEQTVDWQTERNRIVSVEANNVEEAFNLIQKLNLRLE